MKFYTYSLHLYFEFFHLLITYFHIVFYDLKHQNVILKDYLINLINKLTVKWLQLKIYNRWGQQVYQGSNGGWDGTFLNKPAPPGVYMILIQYTTKNGENFVTSNTLQLIR